MPTFYTFTLSAAAKLTGSTVASATALEDAVSVLSERELRAAASGVHTSASASLAYARRVGPALVVLPNGCAERVDPVRDAKADASITREERLYADQRVARRAAGGI